MFLFLNALRPNDLIDWATHDPIAVVLFYTLILSLTFLANRVGRGQGNDEPYKYINSIFIYVLCVPGVLSATLWGYSMSFESKSLVDINFFAYYLPIIAMGVGIFIIKQNAVLRTLPWFGELSELLLVLAVAFSFVLFIMHMQVIEFKSVWLVLGVFIVIFGILKFVWERFQRMSR